MRRYIYVFIWIRTVLFQTQKNEWGGYFQYLKKRILRIVPSYLVLGAITYTIADVIVNKGTFKQIVRDLFFITWFSDGSTRYWFILAILIFYAIFPLLYHFLHKDDKGFKRLLILLIGYIMVTGFLHYNFAYYERFMIAIERFPIFVFGVYCGKLSYEKKEVPKVGLIVISALAVIFTFLYYTSHSVRAWISNTHYVYYFLWGILGLWMCFTIIFVLEKISTYWESGYKGIVKVLSFIGNMTLEVYLFHQSYLIVFDYPYSIAGFLFVAIILPILSASMVHKIKSGFLNQKR